MGIGSSCSSRIAQTRSIRRSRQVQSSPNSGRTRLRKYGAGSLAGLVGVFGMAGASSASGAVHGHAYSKGTSAYWAKLFKELHTQKITISVGDWSYNGAGPVNNGDLKVFEKEYPNITVVPDTLSFWVNGSDGEAWYTAMAGGTIPNLSILPLTEPTHMISGGYSANVAPELNALGWTKYLNPVLTSLLRRGSKIYGLGESYYVMGLAINPIIFKEVGLWNAKEGIPEAPKTWTQMVSDAALIKKKLPNVDPFNMGMTDTDTGWEEMNITRSYGCVPETQVHGKWQATFDGPGCVKGYQIIKDLQFPTQLLESNFNQVQSTTIPEKWAANDVAMTLTSDWDVDTFEEQAKMKPNQFSLWPVPAAAVGKNPVPVLGGQYETFSPKDTPLQILAGILWVELQQGLNPLGGPTYLKNAKSVYHALQKEYPGITLGSLISQPISTTGYASNAPAVKELSAAAPSSNLITKYFSAWAASAKYAKPEPPEYTQQFYQLMADASQKILESKSSNIASILKSSAAQFTSEYLK